jgi:hypothetical protein
MCGLTLASPYVMGLPRPLRTASVVKASLSLAEPPDSAAIPPVSVKAPWLEETLAIPR